jgi:hypothetical protein
LLSENISERNVQHHLATVEASHLSLLKDTIATEYQKCRALHELRLSCVGTAPVCLFAITWRSENSDGNQQFYRRERTPRRNLDRKRVGLKNRCAMSGEEEICPYWEPKTASPIVQPVAHCSTRLIKQRKVSLSKRNGKVNQLYSLRSSNIHFLEWEIHKFIDSGFVTSVNKGGPAVDVIKEKSKGEKLRK